MSLDRTTPILLLTMSLGLGGAETHVVSLAKNLKSRSWDVAVASAGGPLVPRLARDGVPHFHAPLDSRSPLDMVKAAKTIRGLVAGRKIGLIHAHARIPAWIAESIARKAGIPMVVTYHGTFVSGVFWNHFTRAGHRTIAVSPDIKEYIVEKFGFSPDKVTVIPNGIDLDTYRPAEDAERAEARSSLGLESGRSPVVVYASRLESDLTAVAKTTADAAEILHHKYPGLALLIAGDGDGLGSVKEAAAQVNARAGASVVRCLGFVQNPYPVYAAADVVVGMSRVALEAAASETAVVIAGPGGLFGALSPENAASLEERNFTTRGASSPLTPESLASQIESLLSDEVKRRSLARFARGLAASEHSMERVTEETEQVYRLAMSDLPR